MKPNAYRIQIPAASDAALVGMVGASIVIEPSFSNSGKEIGDWVCAVKPWTFVCRSPEDALRLVMEACEATHAAAKSAIESMRRTAMRES